MSYRASFLLIVLLAVFAGAGASAQALDDPTRPPPNLLAGNAKAPAGTPAEAALPQLQSVLIARGAHGRHVAVIDGVTVRLGEKFKGARLEQVSETEVVLVQGKRRQILKMFPAPAPGAAPHH